MKKQIYLLSAVLIFAANLFADPLVSGGRGNSMSPKSAPLVLVENVGQVKDQGRHARSDIQFAIVVSEGLNVFVGNGELHYQFRAKNVDATPVKSSHLPANFRSSDIENKSASYTMSRIDVELIGANKKAKIIKEEKQDYFENYWASGVPGTCTIARSFTRISYEDIYPNIDWVLYTSGGHVKQEFVVRKGGKVGDIKLKYKGCSDLTVDASGALTAGCSMGMITENTPCTFQEDGKKIRSAFKLNRNTLSFEVADYSGKIVIDPELLWATYYGGSGEEQGACVGTDNAGNVYMAGSTGSASAIATTGAHQVTYGGGSYDAFLVKFDNTGARLWATYYGGTGDDAITSVAVDGAGNIYATGFTTTLTGLATPGAFQGASGGSYDAFLAKFNNAGVLVWSTFYGGSRKEFAYSVAIDPFGYVYMGGQSNSTSGVASPGAFQDTISDPTSTAEDAFVAKFDSTGARIWATYYGGLDFDFGNAVATDAAGNVYLAGMTNSNSSIATAGAHQVFNAGGMYDAFLVKFSSSGSRLWGTYFGGTDEEWGYSLTTDAAGSVYMGGYTKSTSGISSPGSYQDTAKGSYDGFLAKFNGTGSIIWSTYYGGYSDDYIYSVTTDDSSNVFVAGETSSLNAIATSGAWQPAYGGGAYDAYVAKFDSLGARKWGTYFGGNGSDQAYGVVTGSGKVYVAGGTLSLSHIATAGAYQTGFGGGTMSGDAFLAVLQPGNKVGVDPVSMPEQEILRVYPNPAGDHFAVDVKDEGVLTIYATDGRGIYSRKLATGTTEIELPSWTAAGIYGVTFRSTTGAMQTAKLILNPVH